MYLLSHHDKGISQPRAAASIAAHLPDAEAGHNVPETAAPARPSAAAATQQQRQDDEQEETDDEAGLGRLQVQIESAVVSGQSSTTTTEVWVVHRLLLCLILVCSSNLGESRRDRWRR